MNDLYDEYLFFECSSAETINALQRYENHLSPGDEFSLTGILQYIEFSQEKTIHKMFVEENLNIGASWSMMNS